MHREKKTRGYIALGVLWSITCLAMFTTGGSFSRATGEALKYYFIDDTGQIILREHSGVDSNTGTKLQKVTPEIMRQYRSQQKGTLKVTDETIYDPKTGKALKRYYQGIDGKITLFSIEVEFHPDYGTRLEIITPEIAIQYSKQQNISIEPTSIPIVNSPQPLATPKTFPTFKFQQGTLPEFFDKEGWYVFDFYPWRVGGVFGVITGGHWKVTIIQPKDTLVYFLPTDSGKPDISKSKYLTMQELGLTINIGNHQLPEGTSEISLSEDSDFSWKLANVGGINVTWLSGDPKPIKIKIERINIPAK